VIERLDEFMARANAAYYATRDPFADFTTSPEISQIFGELIGLWVGCVWQSMGSPNPFILAEAGPGRGTLMSDALRAIMKALPACRTAISLHLVETSARLGAVLAERLPDALIHKGLDDIPQGPIILIGNEFLDALPIRQFVCRNAGWMERYVDNGQFIERPAVDDLPSHPVGTVLERCDGAAEFIDQLSCRIARSGGAALLIDYGPSESAPGDTLQAISHGRFSPLTLEPGTADLTAHVDFAALAARGRKAGCSVSGPVPQGVFLACLGIHERTAQLGKAAKAQDALNLLAATRRLTSPEAMGGLFKAMAIRHPELAIPPGFPA